jgi:ribosome biogenesis SPOUT family RNA methylase Rps3
MAVYVIEHLEPKIYPWCLIEYKNISGIVGKASLWFTNIKEKSKNSQELSNYGKIISSSVCELNLKNICVLDPAAKKTLNPWEAKAFDYFIFGGILGDYPPKKRTSPELTKKVQNAEARNIGRKQFSTDNAVWVTKQIAEGKNLEDLKFKNKIEIKINEIESVILPYIYPVVNGKPQISDELISFIKRKKKF